MLVATARAAMTDVQRRANDTVVDFNQSETTCPACGTVFRTDQTRCPDCGLKFG